MTKDETLKLALEALEEAWYHVGTFQPTEKAIDLYDEARTAIKEALANVATNDTSQECVDKTSEIVHEAQRTWVGLEDDDEIDWDGGDIKSFVRAIEAALKAKNT